MKSLLLKSRNKASPDNYRLGQIGGWVSILANLVLFVIKLYLGLISRSMALIADAFHTLSDIITSAVVVISFRVAQKPGDVEHPFGHGQADYIATIIIATLLAVTGFEIGRSSIQRILNPEPVRLSWFIIAVVFLTIFFKEGLAKYSESLGKKIESQSLKADAWHHRSDALSSVVVVVAMIFSYFGMPLIDGLAGLFIGLLITYTAYKISKKSLDNLLGVIDDEDLIHRVEEIALGYPEVLGVHDIIVHSYGNVKVISYHIEVDEKLSLTEAHDISDTVDQKIRRKLNVHTTVHVDPVMRRTKEYKEIENILRDYFQAHADVLSFHDLRIIEENEKKKLFLDLVIKPESKIQNEKKFTGEIRSEILKKLPEISDIQVKVEPKFSISRRSRHN